jgi:hypothetical protein
MRQMSFVHATAADVSGTAPVIGYGMLSRALALFERRFDMAVSRANTILGLIIAVTCLGGTLFSSLLSDRWRRMNVEAARFRVSPARTVICAPMAVLWPLADNASAAFVMLGVSVYGLSISQAAAPACIQEVSPNNMREQAISVRAWDRPMDDAGWVGFGSLPPRPLEAVLRDQRDRVADCVCGDLPLLYWVEAVRGDASMQRRCRRRTLAWPAELRMEAPPEVRRPGELSPQLDELLACSETSLSETKGLTRTDPMRSRIFSPFSSWENGRSRFLQNVDGFFVHNYRSLRQTVDLVHRRSALIGRGLKCCDG